MKQQQSSGILLLTIVFLIVVPLLMGGACGERNLPLQVENRTDIALTIYVQEHEAGSVEPYQSVKVKGIPGTLTHYLIEAKNDEGEVIYSRKFSTSELHDADWKVVIPPSQKGSESSDIVTAE